MRFALVFLAAMLWSSGVAAGLNDKFIYSSKFGLLTESVTSSWSSENVSGLTFGGALNGVPRDSAQTLYHYNGKLSLVAMRYALEPLTFETEKAYKRWTVQAFHELMERATKKYGSPTSENIQCPLAEPFDTCQGEAVWRGEAKVFVIRVAPYSYNKYVRAYYGFPSAFRLEYIYADSADYDLMIARLPSLLKARDERFNRRIRRVLSDILKTELRKTGYELDEYLSTVDSPFGKIQEILRKTSNTYVGGVKANYTPERWARSFRFQ